jgi:Rieske Fe-S protein
MGCTVDSVGGGVITCPCHGSQYSIVDGSVKGGPAPHALAAKTISVANNEILLRS